MHQAKAGAAVFGGIVFDERGGIFDGALRALRLADHANLAVFLVEREHHAHVQHAGLLGGLFGEAPATHQVVERFGNEHGASRVAESDELLAYLVEACAGIAQLAGSVDHKAERSGGASRVNHAHVERGIGPGNTRDLGRSRKRKGNVQAHGAFVALFGQALEQLREVVRRRLRGAGEVDRSNHAVIELVGRDFDLVGK